MSKQPAFAEVVRQKFVQLARAAGQSRSARTIEYFGWLILAEGTAIVLAPGTLASLVSLPPPDGQATAYVRLVGLLVSGLGLLYVASGRLNLGGFVFASLLDRPLVVPAMAVLWAIGWIPAPLALVFSIQDFGGFLWTLLTWRAEVRAKSPDTG